MPAELIEGKVIGAAIREELRSRIAALAGRGVTPGLAVVLVGEDPASVSYVQGKMEASAELGVTGETIRIAADVAEDELLQLIAGLNRDPRYHGIIVQLPLPSQIDAERVTGAVDPNKDVDGLHPVNQGRLLRGEPGPRPCTPAGIQQMLVRSGNDPSGQHVVICGRSNLVGKPLAAILMQKAPGANATVTLCHTGTPDLAAFTRQADIVVAAMGRPGTITADMVRDGVVVIDVGTNRVADATRKRGWRLVGDVDFEGVREKAKAITPVPGGVGPMTVTMLLANTVAATEATLKD
jgi:methylenetetrahydrofolate dehydrogenase (NADP+)/methenyltetrahydrofolate cyclohydrolase